MSYNVKERKEMENNIANFLCSKKKGKIQVDIVKGYNNRILSYSPHSIWVNTNKYLDNEAHYKYAHLSRRIHSDDFSKRSNIEDKIRKIIPLKAQYIHLIFNEYFESYKSVCRYCDENDIPYITKQQYRTACNLIKQWKIASQEEHHNLTQQQKRKLKKLSKQYKNGKICR